VHAVIEPRRFLRTHPIVEAVYITDENLPEVAEWIGGEVVDFNGGEEGHDDGEGPYVPDYGIAVPMRPGEHYGRYAKAGTYVVRPPEAGPEDEILVMSPLSIASLYDEMVDSPPEV
jgi:hypothetical protein